MRRILLLGYFGAGNLGDDCLLADFLLAHGGQLRARGIKADIVFNGKAPLAGFSEGPQLEQLVGDCIDKREVLGRGFKDYSALVLPGGSVLQDSTSLKSLLYYLEVIRRAAGAGTPVCLLHQGIGPLNAWLARFLTPRWLRRASLLSLRDQQCYDWASARVGALKGGGAPVLSADPVLAGRLSAPAELLPADLRPGGYVLCVPRPTGKLPHSGDLTSEAPALARLLLHAAEISGLPIVLAAFHPSSDSAFITDVKALCADKARVYAAPARADGQESSAMLALVRSAGLLIGYRLHSLVIAGSGAVPSLGVAYDPKVSAFCEELGYPCCYPAEVHEQNTLDLLSGLWDARETVAADCAQRREPALQRLHAAEAQFQQLL